MRTATLGVWSVGIAVAICTLAGCDRPVATVETTEPQPSGLPNGLPDYFSNSDSYAFDFELADLEGNTVSKQDFEGKILVVDIWGTWCPPCRAEIPDLVKLQEEYESQGVQFLGITDVRADTQQGSIDEVNDFTSRVPINYPLVFGTQETYLQVPHFEVFPTKVLIDRNGKVRRTEMGGRPEAYMRSLIEELLAEDSTSENAAEGDPAAS